MLQTAEAVDVVRGGYANFATGDIPGVLSRFSPEINWTIPGPSALAGRYQAPSGVGEFFAKIAAGYQRLEVTVDRYVPNGDDEVIAIGHHDVTGPGGTFRLGFVHLWQVRDGLATSFYEYTDTETLGRALGA